jgi:cytosine/adenosine deaminase-related metal-dependent hydrolase
MEDAFSLKARFVFPITSPPLENGLVTIARGRIVAVSHPHGPYPDSLRTPTSDQREGNILDLGNAAILPGLVNAHTHLEFSHLAAPIGPQGIGLADWIRRLIEIRQNRKTQLPRCLALGLNESARCGVTTLGEIAGSDFPWDDVSNFPLGGVLFGELIAPCRNRIPAALDFARSWVADRSTPTRPWRIGLSPHAPYSVHPELLQEVIRISVAHKIPLAIHLAESREELQLLAEQSGPLCKLLEERDTWDPSAFSSPRRPLDFLQMLAAAHRTLIIHGNYLEDDEIAFLARHVDRFSVVYCPRSHAWFRHDPYPLEKMLTAGVNVALGTDSRASAPNLSLLAEMRFVAQNFPQLPKDTILQMGTLNGARALGLDQEIGSLEPGKEANLALVSLPNNVSGVPHDLLQMNDNSVIAMWYRGKALGKKIVK